MIKEILPLLDEKVYNYDGNDNLVSFTDEEGQKTTVRYDLNNQPTAMTYSDGRTASFRYNKWRCRIGTVLPQWSGMFWAGWLR